MQKADYWLRLMKQRTDELLAADEQLQQFLMWVRQKSLSVKVPYKPAAVRAFYFALDRAFDRALDCALDRAYDPALVRALDLALDLALIGALDPTLDLALMGLDWTAIASHLVAERHTGDSQENDLGINALPLALLDRTLNPKHQDTLQQLKEQHPDPDKNIERLKTWWQANGQAWTDQLRTVMIKHRNVGHDWQFTDKQKELMTQYYDANKLLVDCLSSSCNVTPEVRSHIEETLLLPTEMLPNAEG